MTTGSEPAGPAPVQRFQFTLAGAFYVLTGVAVAMSCIACHPWVGSIAAHLMVGAAWAYLAWRSGHRRLAYYLAASVQGTVGGIVLLVCGLVAFGPPLVIWSELNWLAEFCLLMALAAVICARLLAGSIREPQDGLAVGTSIFAVYLTSIFFGWLLIPASWISGFGFDAATLVCAGPLLVTAGSFVVATVTLPIMLPIAMGYCVILRTIHPLPSLGPNSRATTTSITSEGRGQKKETGSKTAGE